ncbi:MAG: hypothetical protein U0326_42880 [Polyangiales bacterium]
MRALLVVALLAAVTACGPRFSCPIGQQPLCQSGPRYGTQCYCVEPNRSPP